MKCEIEFLPVGEKSSAGDAIVVRYGEEHNYGLMLVDGGTSATGREIVDHLKLNFGAQVGLQHVVLTHSDADHASGLRSVLEEIPVANLWLHIPWEFAAQALHLFEDKRWTVEGLQRSIKSSYPIIAEIVDLAQKQGTVIRYPFRGETIGPFHCLGPSSGTYTYLMPQFGSTPDPDKDAIKAADLWLGKAPSGIWKAAIEAVIQEVKSWMPESWAVELLRDGGVTSASNESSVILYGECEKGVILLTGDAGNWALTWAADYAERINLPIGNFAFFQIPHHGSRRNIGPTILNRLVGYPQLSMGPRRFFAFVSAPKDDEKHPRKIVTNALRRRGAEVVVTQGDKQVWWGGFSARNGYNGPGKSIPFSSIVEAYDD